MSEVNELREFHRFLGAKLANGGADMWPEEALEEWRDLHPEPWDDEDDLTAIQVSIDDFDKGERGMPFEEFMEELRAKLDLPGQANP